MFLSLVAAFALSADANEELKRFEGVWVIADAIAAGRDHKEDFKDLTMTITGDKYVIDFGLKSDAGTLTLDANRTPKWIDIKSKPNGPFMGRTLPGIYKFDNDTLILCCNTEKSDRPTTFEAKEKTPLMLLTFTRAKK